MSKFHKVRPLTELEDLKQSFPLYDETPLRGRFTVDGKILSIETDSNPLKAILRAKGFIET